jgi:hypothetical protein
VLPIQRCAEFAAIEVRGIQSLHLDEQFVRFLSSQAKVTCNRRKQTAPDYDARLYFHARVRCADEQLKSVVLHAIALARSTV